MLKRSRSLFDLLSHPDTAAVDDVLAKDDLTESIKMISADNVVTFVKRNLPHIVSVALKELPDAGSVELDDPRATTYPGNATELLVQYVSCELDANGTPNVVPLVFGTLAKKGALHPVIAQNISRVMLAAFGHNAELTTEYVTVALNEEVMHGVIRHLATSYVIGDMLLGLFGSALSPEVAILVQPLEFVQTWVAMHFAKYLAAYIPVAMADDNCMPYFHFLNELVKRGLSQHCGPLVDELLSGAVVQSMISSVGDAVEACCSGSQVDWPLACEGVSILTCMMVLVQQTKGPTNCEEEYGSPARNLEPVAVSLKELHRFIAVLPQENSAPRPGALGAVRMQILQFVISLFRLSRRATDQVLIQMGFFEKLFNLMEAHPNNDLLHSFLDEVCIEVLLRTYNEEILPHFCGEGQLCERILCWCSRKPDAPITALCAHAANIAQSFKRKNIVPREEAVRLKWDAFLRNDLDLLTSHWNEEITGDAFQQVGTGPSDPIVHRTVVNPKNASIKEGSAASSPVIPAPSIPNVPNRQFAADRYVQYDLDDDDDEHPPIGVDKHSDYWDAVFDSSNVLTANANTTDDVAPSAVHHQQPTEQPHAVANTTFRGNPNESPGGLDGFLEVQITDSTLSPPPMPDEVDAVLMGDLEDDEDHPVLELPSDTTHVCRPPTPPSSAGPKPDIDL